MRRQVLRALGATAALLLAPAMAGAQAPPTELRMMWYSDGGEGEVMRADETDGAALNQGTHHALHPGNLAENFFGMAHQAIKIIAAHLDDNLPVNDR